LVVSLLVSSTAQQRTQVEATPAEQQQAVPGWQEIFEAAA
jgi:hypothetical protein